MNGPVYSYDFELSVGVRVPSGSGCANHMAVFRNEAATVVRVRDDGAKPKSAAQGTLNWKSGYYE
jgi:hypothetical protein